MSGGNAMTMQSGTNIFSRQDMAMMIVDRDKATMGMTDAQKVAARQEEMTKDRAGRRISAWRASSAMMRNGPSSRRWLNPRRWTSWTRR